MTVEQWLGKDNSLGIDIWNRKYKKNNETFDEWLDRVSGNNEAIKILIIEKNLFLVDEFLAIGELLIRE